MIKHGISIIFCTLLVFSATTMFSETQSSALETYLAHNGDPYSGLNLLTNVYAQPDMQMESQDYRHPSPAKQTESGIAAGNIMCNEPRMLYINQSEMPLCLFVETYGALQSRGMTLTPVSQPEGIFSPEEAEWLENNPVIRVSYDPGLVPIEYLDDSGILQGVTLDYIAEFEAVSGADLIQGPIVETWAETLKTIEDRESDIIFIVAPAPERLEYMSFTSSHYSLKTYMASLNDAPLNIDDDSLVLITIRGYAIESWLDENHPNIQYVSVDDQSEAFEVLQAGGADAFASTWPSVVHYSKLSGIDNIYNAGSTGHQYDLAVGYRNDLPILGSIMQKTLDDIPQQKINSWYDKISYTTDENAVLESLVKNTVRDTVAIYKADPDNAFAQINSMFSTDHHYPFVVDPATRQIVAYGADPNKVGNTSIALTKSDVPFETIISELEDGPAWAEYVLRDPLTQTDKHKRFMFVMHDGYIFGAGYFATQESIMEDTVNDAIALYKADPDNAFAQINSMMSTDYHYPFVLDSDTLQILAYGADPHKVGKVAVGITKSDIPLDEILSRLQDGPVWADLIIQDPLTQTDQHKRYLYVMHDGYIFGSRYFVAQETIVGEVVNDAIALYKADPDNAFAQINSMMSTDYHYPFVLDSDTLQILAYGADPHKVGKVAVGITKSDIPLDEILSRLQDGPVWADLIIQDPLTQTDQHKRYLYVMHDGYIFGSRYFVAQETIVGEVVNDAIALYKADPENAFDRINSMPSTDYHYPFIINATDQVIVAYGAEPNKTGKISKGLTASSVPLETLLAELEDGPVWTETITQDPVTQTDQHKRFMYAMYDGYIFGSRYFVAQDVIVRDVVNETIALYKADPENAFDRINSMPSTDYHYPFIINATDQVIVAYGAEPNKTGKISKGLTASSVPLETLLAELEDGPVWTETITQDPVTQTDQHKRFMYAMYDGYIFGSRYFVAQDVIVRDVVNETIALYKADPENAFDRINSMPSTDYHYPFVADYDTGILLAHGVNPNLVGTCHILVPCLVQKALLAHGIDPDLARVAAPPLIDSDKSLDQIRSDLLEGPVWITYMYENPAIGADQAQRIILVLHDGHVFGSVYYEIQSSP